MTREEIMTRNTRKRWTRDEEEKLIELYVFHMGDGPRFQGKVEQTLTLCSHMLGRSKAAVSDRVQKLKGEKRIL